MQSCAANPGEDADAAGLQEAAPFGKGMIVDVIEEEVVALLALGEVFFRVVDDVISAGALTAADYVLATGLAVRSVGLTREVNH